MLWKNWTHSKRFEEAENKLEEANYTLSDIKGDDSEVAFYTGFPSFSTLKAFFNFLGPAVDSLKYSKRQEKVNVLSGAENKCIADKEVYHL